MTDVKLAKQFSWTVSGRFIAAALNLGVLMVYSRFLGPSEYGRLALAQAGAVTLYSILFYWLIESITRMSKEQGEHLAQFRGAVLVGYASAGFVSFIITAVVVWLAGFAGYTNIFFLSFIAVGAAVTEALTFRNLEHFRAFSQSTLYATTLVLRAILIFVFVWGGFVVFGKTAEIAMLGQMFGCLATALTAEILTRQSITIDKSCWTRLAKMFRYGGPISTALIFRTAIQRIDRFIIGYFFGTETVGLYALAFDFANRALSIPLIAVNTVTYPLIVNAWETNNKNEQDRLSHLNWDGLMLLGIPASVGLIMISQNALSLLFGANYSGGTVSLIMIIATGCMFLEAIRNYHFDIAFLLKQKNQDQVFISIVGFVINIIAGLIIIPLYSSIGAALVALSTVAVMLGLSIKIGHKHHAMSVSFFPTLAIFISTIPMAVILWRLGNAADILTLTAHIGLAVFVYLISVLSLNILNSRTLLLAALRKRKLG